MERQPPAVVILSAGVAAIKKEASLETENQPASYIVLWPTPSNRSCQAEIPVVLGAPLREQRDGHFDIERIRSGRVFCRLAALLHVPPPTG